MLECGHIFTASKSLFLDGINYVKISDGRGWVFSKKGDTQVLDLLEVYRKPETAVEGDVRDVTPLRPRNTSPERSTKESSPPPL